ncbi:hypothetical protein [Lapidilactobacillus salsurivasis]
MVQRKTSSRRTSAEPDLIVDLSQPTAAGRRSERLESERHGENTTPTTRMARREAELGQPGTGTVAHPKMRRRLNWALVIVSLLIILTYLALFFL